MIGLLLTATVAAQPGPYPPTLVTSPPAQIELGTALASLNGQGGVTLRAVGFPPQTACPTSYNRAPLWAALEEVARKVNGRLTLAQQGRQISLAPRGDLPPAPAFVDGPFRVAVRSVTSRLDFDTGSRLTEVTLDLHWEPRLTVVRADATPTITTATDDRSTPYTIAPISARVPPTGAMHTTTVRVPNVPRSATKLTKLAGSFLVTATDRYLTVKLPQLPAGKPVTQEQDGVRAAVHPPRKLDDVIEVRVEVGYPESHPTFESFESWAAGNRLRLISPSGRPLDPTDYATQEAGRRAVCEYRFPAAAVGDLKGWSLTYDTPAPLREFPVRFELVDIPLP
jgi:hypothetical protein